jgi:protein-tyrosine-phosphatase
MQSEVPTLPQSPPIRNVIFVCAHGAAKSVIAGSYFNLLAERHGLSARAVARGTEPDAEVAERVRQDASDTGLELCATRPTRLGEADVASADVLIAFDLTASDLGSSSPHLAWDGLPALSQDFERGKAAIVTQVEALVAHLKARADLGDT